MKSKTANISTELNLPHILEKSSNKQGPFIEQSFDKKFNKYLWDMCMARLSECLTPYQFMLFENLSAYFESSTLTLRVANYKIIKEIESFICESEISSIFRDVYGNGMKLMYETDV